MSYVDMDHAAWVQRNIEAGKRIATLRERRLAENEHRGWWAAPNELNDFQKRAFGILGIIGNGIYNAPISWKRVFWEPRYLSMPWMHTLSTFDFTQLTRFVFLCHEARIRGEIAPLAPRYLDITLTERTDVGSVSQRHPTLEEAIAAFREEFPRDHSINFRKSEQAA